MHLIRKAASCLVNTFIHIDTDEYVCEVEECVYLPTGRRPQKPPPAGFSAVLEYVHGGRYECGDTLLHMDQFNFTPEIWQVYF